ncbi:MAG TPA: 2'-5' RNA ligase family protein [Roseiflexaceae bacterium]|nr:2'-5' RNA ligase family protein [Roseiflexaceae bacterium]
MANEVYAVVSPISGGAQAEALTMWELLERRYGVRAARAAIHPHMTYVVGEGGDPQALAERLDVAASAAAPLTVTIDGLGIFCGPSPVIFLRVIHDAVLAQLYARIVEAVRRAGLALWPHYAPGTWVPHVTLALRDVPPAALPAMLEDLGRRRSRFRTPIRDIRLVRVARPVSESVYIGAFPLGGEDEPREHEDAKVGR